MATYKKRGYKPKATKENDGVDDNFNEEESTTAEVFNNLDEGANKTEEWVAGNQKPILIVIGVIVIAVLAYLGYSRFVQQPKEFEAADEIAQSQIYFENALDATSKDQDSLFNLALNGGNGKFGLLKVIDHYGSTSSGNIAHYYAGIAYLNTGKYKEAIDQLEDFKSDDEVLAPLAKGAIGDAFMQLNQPEEALGYYEKAAKMRNNKFTTPKFLMKAAITAIQLKKGADAEKHLTRIEEEYSDSPEAEEVSVYLGQAQGLQ
ncbi:tetratricopeptide repeat protein [Mesonia sp.]|uniref:tetratricopeptide repeat protein n=1 Tax=Mesonia sp. TaxID=1960830 RepID=UPI003F9C54AB